LYQKQMCWSLSWHLWSRSHMWCSESHPNMQLSSGNVWKSICWMQTHSTYVFHILDCLRYLSLVSDSIMSYIFLNFITLFLSI
jgi:hypothetical protein